MTSAKSHPNDRALALIQGIAGTRLRVLRRDATPRTMRSTLRLYEWARQKPHVVVFGARTHIHHVLPAALDDEDDRECWMAACERESDR